LNELKQEMSGLIIKFVGDTSSVSHPATLRSIEERLNASSELSLNRQHSGSGLGHRSALCLAGSPLYGLGQPRGTGIQPYLNLDCEEMVDGRYY
jgi:hypothetical protein